MRRNPRLFWLVLAVGASLIVGACVAYTQPKARKEIRGLRAHHPVHAEQGLDCSTCHEPSDGTYGFPTHDVCAVCHEINVDEPTEEQCGFCHTQEGYEVAPWTNVLKPELRFNHVPHVEKGLECATCHAAPDVSVLPAGSPKPFCMDCHGKTDPKLNACSVCHTEISKDERPQFRAGARIPHDAPTIWTRVHGNESKVDPKFCALCHETPSYCDSCHQTKAPADHTLTWRRKTHGLEASWARDKCSVCHEEDSCLKCHRNTQPSSHGRAWGAPVNSHCTSCHYPPTKTGCVVCHESIDHPSALPSPHKVLIYPQQCGVCHPGGLAGRSPHPDNSTVRCGFCH